MQTPVNTFKQALAEKRPQIGLWVGLASHYTTEICAGAGFDWLLLDAEHSPNDLRSLLQQAQVVAGYPGTHAIARVPMVDTAEQAQRIVRGMRYPPDGHRGMAGARGNRWGRLPNYGKEANAQVCLLVQIETQAGLENLEAIAAVEGVDGVFVGPADLSASLGFVGQPTHPDMQATIDGAIARIVKSGKAAGILTTDDALARHYLGMGATFVAVGLDNNLLARATSELAARFKTGLTVAPQGKTY